MSEPLMKPPYYKWLYIAGSAYDVGLGIGFLILWPWIFKLFDIAKPDNPAYVSLIAIFIAAYGIFLFFISLKPEESKRMIAYAIIMKFAFIGVVGAYLIVYQLKYIPWPFIVLAGCDLVWAILFFESMRQAKS